MTNFDDVLLTVAEDLWREEQQELERLVRHREELRQKLGDELERMVGLGTRAAGLRRDLERLTREIAKAALGDHEKGEELREWYASLTEELERIDAETQEAVAVLAQHGIRGPDWSRSCTVVRDALYEDSKEERAVKRRVSQEALALAAVARKRAEIVAGEEAGLAEARFIIETTGGHLDPERIERERLQEKRRRDDHALAHGFVPFPEDEAVG